MLPLQGGEGSISARESKKLLRCNQKVKKKKSFLLWHLEGPLRTKISKLFLRLSPNILEWIETGGGCGLKDPSSSEPPCSQWQYMVLVKSGLRFWEQEKLSLCVPLLKTVLWWSCFCSGPWVPINQFSGIHFYRPSLRVWHGALYIHSSRHTKQTLDRHDQEKWLLLPKPLQSRRGGRYRNHNHSTNKNYIGILNEALRAEARGSGNFGVPLSSPFQLRGALSIAGYLQRGQIRSQ